VYLNTHPGDLPDEPDRLAIVLAGPRDLAAWQGGDSSPMDFYDLKGVVEAFFGGLHLVDVRYEPGDSPSYHPGKNARVLLAGQPVGMLGELDPRVQEGYEFPAAPVQAAVLDLKAILAAIPVAYPSEPVPAFPPVLEDLAVIVDENIPAGQVEEVIWRAGGQTLAGLRLFDVYRSPAIGVGKKSLAYSLAYQDPEKTLTDQEVAAVRQRIIRQLETELAARLRS
jgi:phenylalanyl-tRNA synthetase beta chain